MAERVTSAERAAHPRLFDRQVIGPFNGRQLAIAAAAVAIVAFLLLAVTTPLAHSPNSALPQPGSNFYQVSDAEVGLQVGQQAPELVGMHDTSPITLTDLNGQAITLAALRGKPVWLNFWATWCPPCQEETPILRDVYGQFKNQGVALVSVSVQETSIDDVRSYAATYGLEYTIGFDATSAIFHTYHAFGLPTQFFIDRNGVIRQVILGPVTREQAAGYIEGLLAAP